MAAPSRRVQRVLDGARHDRPAGPAFYYAQAPWPEEDFGGQLSEVDVYDATAGIDPRWRDMALRGLSLSTQQMVPVKLARSPITGLWEPQGRHPDLDLYVPSGALRERFFDQEMAAQILQTFPDIGIPEDWETMRTTALQVLADIGPDLVLDVLLKVTWQLEAEGSCGPYEAALLEDARWPAAIHDRLQAGLRDGRPWLHPMIMQHLIMEAAAARHLPIKATRSLRTLAQSSAFHRLIRPNTFENRGRAILRAVFAYQSTWAPPRGLQGDDEFLSTLALGRIRHAPLDQHDSRMLISTRQYRLDDSDEHLDKGAKPSAFASALYDATGMTVDQHASFGGIALLSLLIDGRTGSGDGTAFFNRLPADLRRAGIAALRRWLASDLAAAGVAAVRASKKSGAYGGWGTLPPTAGLYLDQFPILRHRGTHHAVGINQLNDAWAHLPERLLVVNEGWHENTVRTQVGYMFSAVMTDATLRLDGYRQNRFFTDAQIADFFGSGTRPDGLLSDGDSHLILEFQGGRIIGRASEGDAQGVRNLLGKYIHKLRQAQAAQWQLPDLLEHLGRPRRVGMSTCLVVIQDPMIVNPVYARELVRQGGQQKFYCSAEEYEYLLALGSKGVGVPAAVRSWQAGSLQMPLGRWLSEHGLGKIVSVREQQMEASSRALIRGLPPAA